MGGWCTLGVWLSYILCRFPNSITARQNAPLRSRLGLEASEPRPSGSGRLGMRGTFHALSNLSPAHTAPGSFALGVRQSVSAGAGGTGAGGTRRRIHRRRTGVELPRGASGTARQCVAHRGPAGAVGGAAWRPPAHRGLRARAGVGALRRCRAATPLPALLSEILRGGVRQRAVQPGAVALLQRVPGGLAALFRNRWCELPQRTGSAAYVRLFPAD